MASYSAPRRNPATPPLLFLLVLVLLRVSVGQQVKQAVPVGPSETSVTHVTAEDQPGDNDARKLLDKRSMVGSRGSSFQFRPSKTQFGDTRSRGSSGSTYAGDDGYRDEKGYPGVGNVLHLPARPHFHKEVGDYAKPTGNRNDPPEDHMVNSHYGNNPSFGSMGGQHVGGMGHPTGTMGYPHQGSISGSHPGSMGGSHVGRMGHPPAGNLVYPHQGSMNDSPFERMDDPQAANMVDLPDGGMGGSSVGSEGSPPLRGLGVSPSAGSMAKPSVGTVSNPALGNSGNLPLGGRSGSPPVGSTNRPSAGDMSGPIAGSTNNQALGSVDNSLSPRNMGTPPTESLGSSFSGGEPVPQSSNGIGSEPGRNGFTSNVLKNPGRFAGNKGMQVLGGPIINFPARGAGGFSSTLVRIPKRNCLGFRSAYPGPQQLFGYRYPGYGSYFARPYFMTYLGSIPGGRMGVTQPMLRCPWGFMNSFGGYMPIPFRMVNPSPLAGMNNGQNALRQVTTNDPPQRAVSAANAPSSSHHQSPSDRNYPAPPSDNTNLGRPVNSNDAMQNPAQNIGSGHFVSFDSQTHRGYSRNQRQVTGETVEDNPWKSQMQYAVDPQSQEIMDDSLTWQDNSLNSLAWQNNNLDSQTQQNNNLDPFHGAAQPFTNTNSDTAKSSSIDEGDTTSDTTGGLELIRKARSAGVNIRHVRVPVQGGNQFEATLKFNESCFLKAACTVPSTWASLATSLLQHLPREVISENLDLESFFCSCSIKEISNTCPRETRELINVFSGWCTRGDNPRGMRSV